MTESKDTSAPSGGVPVSDDAIKAEFERRGAFNHWGGVAGDSILSAARAIAALAASVPAVVQQPTARPDEDSKTAGGQKVIDNVPLQHEGNGASDWCMHCGVNMCSGDPRAAQPCEGLERARRRQIKPETVVAFGCDREANGGEVCAQWCQGVKCAYTRAAPSVPAAPAVLPTYMLAALTNLANVFLEGRANAASEGDEGYVQSVIDAAECAINAAMGVAGSVPAAPVRETQQQSHADLAAPQTSRVHRSSSGENAPGDGGSAQ